MLTVALLAISAGCHARNYPVSTIKTGDRAVAGQLLFGFYPEEHNQWRWSAREFGVMLQPPPEADSKGARLHLLIYFPDRQIHALGPITLSAVVDDVALPEQTFSAAGSYDYSRAVPADVLRASLVVVKFSLDKAQPPTAAEGRELGAVITSVGLQTN